MLRNFFRSDTGVAFIHSLLDRVSGSFVYFRHEGISGSPAYRLLESVRPADASWRCGPRLSPAGGVGAVAALYDPVALTEMLLEHRDGISAGAVGMYEEKMRQSAAGFIQRTLLAGAKLLGLGDS